MNTANAIDMFDRNFLQHTGQTGMKWHTHKFGRWQSHAVYAQGQPNPDAKERKGIGGKVADKLAIAVHPPKHKYELSDLNNSISWKTDDELRKQTNRLNVESQYMQAVINRNEMNRKFQEMLDAPKRARQKKIEAIGKFIMNSSPVKGTWKMVGNATKYEVYKSLEKKHGKEMASIVTGINQGKKGGGGNQNDK